MFSQTLSVQSLLSSVCGSILTRGGPFSALIEVLLRSCFFKRASVTPRSPPLPSPPIFYSHCFSFTLASRVTANIVFLVFIVLFSPVHLGTLLNSLGFHSFCDKIQLDGSPSASLPFCQSRIEDRTKSRNFIKEKWGMEGIVIVKQPSSKDAFPRVQCF